MIGVAVKNPVNPLHLHFVFESLCVLIRQVSSLYVYLFVHLPFRKGVVFLQIILKMIQENITPD